MTKRIKVLVETWTEVRRIPYQVGPSIPTNVVILPASARAAKSRRVRR